MEAKTGGGLRYSKHGGIRWRVAHRTRIPGERAEDKGLTYCINHSKMRTSGGCP